MEDTTAGSESTDTSTLSDLGLGGFTGADSVSGSGEPTILPDGDKVNTTVSMFDKPETTTPQSTPEGGFPRSQPSPTILFDRDSVMSRVALALAGGVTAISVANAIGVALFGDAEPVTDLHPDLVSRDETHDSIDAATGVLTGDAVAKRAGVLTTDQQVVDAAQAKVDELKAALDAAEAELEKAVQKKAADELMGETDTTVEGPAPAESTDPNPIL